MGKLGKENQIQQKINKRLSILIFAEVIPVYALSQEPGFHQEIKII